VIDLAPTLTPRGRELLVDQARTRSRTKLVEALDRHPARTGVPAIRRLLDADHPSSLTWSQGEERLRALLVRAHVPLPESNVELYTGYTPDLLWRAQRVIVEYDSDQWHAGRVRRAYDTTRQNRLTAEGYVVIPVTCEQLNERSEEVLVWIVRALFRA
jgi:very-short-patch-repair endonuclease